MLLVAPPILGVLLGLLAGGSPANWYHVHIRWPWIFVAAALLRAATSYTPLAAIDAVRYAYVLFLLITVGWTLLQLRALPGVWLVSIGAALNLVVIAANGGHMPVSPFSGFVPRHAGGLYVAADASTRLNWLGDWIGIPGWLGGAASPGDFVIALGIGLVAFLVTQRRVPDTKLDETPTGIRE